MHSIAATGQIVSLSAVPTAHPGICLLMFSRASIPICAPALPTWCIVRNPIDRVASSVAFIEHVRERYPNGLAFARPMRSWEELHAIYAQPRLKVEWDEQVAHLQPQSWAVWREDGTPQCTCAVAFEKIANLTSTHTNACSGIHCHSGPHSELLSFRNNLIRDIYALDHQLWLSAREAPNLCLDIVPRSSFNSKVRDLKGRD